MDMKFLITPLLLISFISFSQTEKPKNKFMENKQLNSDYKDKEVSCKLTSHEMQKRKSSVILELKKQIIEKKDLGNGYEFKFKGSDKIVDQLVDFVKTERLCCSFFNFNLKISGDATYCWLIITGPKGTSDFIKTEMEL